MGLVQGWRRTGVVGRGTSLHLRSIHGITTTPIAPEPPFDMPPARTVRGRDREPATTALT